MIKDIWRVLVMATVATASSYKHRMGDWGDWSSLGNHGSPTPYPLATTPGPNATNFPPAAPVAGCASWGNRTPRPTGSCWQDWNMTWSDASTVQATPLRPWTLNSASSGTGELSSPRQTCTSLLPSFPTISSNSASHDEPAPPATSPSNWLLQTPKEPSSAPTTWSSGTTYTTVPITATFRTNSTESVNLITATGPTTTPLTSFTGSAELITATLPTTSFSPAATIFTGAATSPSSGLGGARGMAMAAIFAIFVASMFMPLEHAS